MGGSIQGGRAASFAAIALAKIECAKGNHSLEVTYATSAATEIVTDEIPSYRRAWHSALQGTDHLINSKKADSLINYNCMYELALRAINDLDNKLGLADQLQPSISGKLDDIVQYLCLAESKLNIAHSLASIDFLRRSKNREIRKESGPTQTFFQKHNTEIHEYWKREYIAWFTSRYRSKYKTEPPEDLFMKNSGTIIGYQLRPGMRHLFDENDNREFFNFTESLYRKEKGLPAKGEKYISQIYLFQCARLLFPNREVQSEARPPWLGSQRLDIFIPALKLAIEYQGEQHYFPIDYLGGEEGLIDRIHLDKRKRDLCIRHDIKLIEWSFRDVISVDSLKRRLEVEGIKLDRG